MTRLRKQTETSAANPSLLFVENRLGTRFSSGVPQVCSARLAQWRIYNERVHHVLGPGCRDPATSWRQISRLLDIVLHGKDEARGLKPSYSDV
jgi:hypothetical protein